MAVVKKTFKHHLGAALKSTFAKPILFLICLLPLANLIWAGFNNGLGANPIEFLTFASGDWTLRFLLLTLVITPLKNLIGIAALARFRRILGLYAFFYGFCHFAVWFVADHSFDFSEMFADVIDRPFITFGFSALVLMLPLAITSNRIMIRLLAQRWKSLHRLIYLIVLLGVLHYLWLVKADYLEPGIYAVIALILLAQRFKKFKLGVKSYSTVSQVKLSQ